MGPSSFIQAINLQLGIYSRSGGLIASAPFSVLTGSGDDSLSDPQIIWDVHSNRFYYLILDVGDLVNPKSTILWGSPDPPIRPASPAASATTRPTSAGAGPSLTTRRGLDRQAPEVGSHRELSPRQQLQDREADPTEDIRWIDADVDAGARSSAANIPQNASSEVTVPFYSPPSPAPQRTDSTRSTRWMVG